MAKDLSIAIETSCRAGGVALGDGDQVIATADFDASARQTTQLISRLADLFAGEGLAATDLQQVYVSVGPGSFTGLRIGVSVARTLGQMVDGLKCVAVPTAEAVAENARNLDWQHLGVVLAAKGDQIYAALFARRDGQIVPNGSGRVMPAAEFLAAAPRPLTLMGEALGYHEFCGQGVVAVDPDLYLPTAQGAWRVGRRMAAAGLFTEYHQLLPVYARQPEAVRLWERRHQGEP